MIKNNYFESIKNIGRKYGIESMYVFGSRAEEIKLLIKTNSGTLSDSDSDLDIGVHYISGVNPSVDNKVMLAQELESLFKVKRIDLADFSEAGPFLALSIIEGELIYCTNEIEQAEFELYILRRAGDLAYFERERRKNILGGEI